MNRNMTWRPSYSRWAGRQGWLEEGQAGATRAGLQSQGGPAGEDAGELQRHMDPGQGKASRQAALKLLPTHSRVEPLGRQVSCTHMCVWHLRTWFSTLAA